MATRSRKPRSSKKGSWVFVEEHFNLDGSKMTPEEILEVRKDEVMNQIGTFNGMHGSQANPFGGLDEYHNFFPDDQEVPEEGAWIMVKKSPPTEYTVPPFSFWFATPWPMKSRGHPYHRVQIVTPKGTLGIFPSEYVLIKNPAKYFEFMGEGMSMHFFSGDPQGLNADSLHYIMSRGVKKQDAYGMLIGQIKEHGVMWLETDRSVASAYVYDEDFPDPARLATA